MNTIILLRVITLALATAIFSNAYSAPSSAQKSLSTIYQMARDYDARFAADQFGAVATNESGSVLNSALLPRVGLNGNYAYNYNNTEYSGAAASNNIDDTYASHGVAVSMKQALLRFDSLYQYRRDSLYKDIAEIEQSIADQNLILRVANIYFLNLKEKENLEVAKARKSAFAENLEKANISFQLGSYTITDKLEAQARYDLANADAIEALNRLSAAQQELLLLIGEIPELSPIGKDTTLPDLSPNNMTYWKDKALSNNLQLNLAAQYATFAERNLSAQKAEYWPKVDLVGSVNYANSDLNDQTRNEAVVSVQFDMPLISGGNTFSGIRKSKALRQKARNEHLLAERQALLNTQTSFLNVVNSYSMNQALSQALKSSESAVKATAKGLEVGVRTNLDLLNAQQQYFETKRDYIHLRYDYLYAWLNLKAVSGALTTGDIDVINGLLATR